MVSSKVAGSTVVLPSMALPLPPEFIEEIVKQVFSSAVVPGAYGGCDTVFIHKLGNIAAAVGYDRPVVGEYARTCAADVFAYAVAAVDVGEAVRGDRAVAAERARAGMCAVAVVGVDEIVRDIGDI